MEIVLNRQVGRMLPATQPANLFILGLPLPVNIP